MNTVVFVGVVIIAVYTGLSIYLYRLGLLPEGPTDEELKYIMP